MQPSLPYTAPELVAGSTSSSDARITPACDVFSLGAIAYELLAAKQLLPVGSSGGEYRARLGMLGTADMSAVPPQLQASAALSLTLFWCGTTMAIKLVTMFSKFGTRQAIVAHVSLQQYLWHALGQIVTALLLLMLCCFP